MYVSVRNLRVYPAAIVMTSLICSVFSPVQAAERPYKQEFVVTAYYSPLPDQCCYFRGTYEEEIGFNGQGIKGADGTGVYPGMIAAPVTYPFGTRIKLDGIGVGTVHDRGGRIIEWSADAHRIDLWMGYGEEGLARALEWGVRHVSGTVYPVADEMPAESIALDTFPSDSSKLAGVVKTDETLILLGLKAEDEGYSVRALQKSLTNLGYLDHEVTGLFGPATTEALKTFQSDYGIVGDGTHVDDKTNAALVAARAMKDTRMPKLAVGLQKGSSGADVRQAQKLMRYLGYYNGRTDGRYSETLEQAVLKFQTDAGVVSDPTQVGAGTVGPNTNAAILSAWKLKQTKREIARVETKVRVVQKVKNSGLESKTLIKGNKGPAVLAVQRILVDAGLLSANEIGGYFGAKTQDAVTQYQIAKGIVTSDKDKGAGVVGPATRNTMVQEAIERGIAKARSLGLGVL
jgi:peptidoglycan hydrolase-like protein with peptidoglycan-binding domain/3D (Asp-Asp-Asp) domain-containing protein